MRTLCEINGVDVLQHDDQRVTFIADFSICADGANGQTLIDGVPQWAYKSGDTGLDSLSAAGYPKFPRSYHEILVCHGDGIPVQWPGGGYVSRTAYEHRHAPDNTPARYLDAASVCYVVTNPLVRVRAQGIVLGCRATIRNIHTGDIVECVVGDVSGADTIGEASILAARLLSVPDSPRHGGDDRQIYNYTFYPGTPAVVGGVTYDLQPA